VLGTDVFLHNAYGDVMRMHGYRGYHFQFRLVCRCTGIDNANSICADLGVGSRVFNKTYTSETKNEMALTVTQTEPVWIHLNEHGLNEWIPWSKIVAESQQIVANATMKE